MQSILLTAMVSISATAPQGSPLSPLGRLGQCRWQNTAELAIPVLDSSVSDSVGVGWSLQICILAKFPSDIDVNGPGTAL